MLLPHNLRRIEDSNLWAGGYPTTGLANRYDKPGSDNSPNWLIFHSINLILHDNSVFIVQIAESQGLEPRKRLITALTVFKTVSSSSRTLSIVPFPGFEPPKAQDLKLLTVPICISHRGIKTKIPGQDCPGIIMKKYLLLHITPWSLLRRAINSVNNMIMFCSFLYCWCKYISNVWNYQIFIPYSVTKFGKI